jgi:prephenate dehydrogenase
VTSAPSLKLSAELLNSMKTVAIVGVGLIGASFGLALRRRGFDGDIIGVSSPSSVSAGLASGAITRSASLEEAAASANLIYLAQPVDRILKTIEQLSGLLRPGVLVSDAGSTKEVIVRKAAACLPSVDFLGGHPLAGKEQRGAQAAEADLFFGKPYILTPDRPVTPAAAELKSWITRMGAGILEMSAREHDSTLALTSHLPQLVSTMLAVTLSRQQNGRLSEIFGPGLIDMIRLAKSSPELWVPILRTNKTAVLSAIEAYAATLQNLQAALENDTLLEFFETGSAWAKQLRGPTPGAQVAQNTPVSEHISQVPDKRKLK